MSRVTALGGVLYVAAGAAALIFVASARSFELLRHPALLVSGACASLLFGVALLWLGAHHRISRRTFPLWIWATQLPTILLISVGVAAVGPVWPQAVVLYVEVPIFAFYLLRPAFASLVVGIAIVGYGVVVFTQPGWHHPWQQLVGLALILSSIGYVFGQLLKRSAQEAERFSNFRRFLPEPVARAVVTSDSADLFDAHRRLITVVFCDLRGFTRFAAAASREDVQEVLDAYFTVVGSHLSDLGATVGAIHGDGVMAYFGDPFPQPDSADRAVRFARQLIEPMADLSRRWQAKSFDLSYGIGIAHGYATLGVVGFDGRNDYTALGPVVNLAARLSDAAGPTETLIDQRTIAELSEVPATHERTLEVKGYAEPVNVHVLNN